MTKLPFERVLVANRGEIACRIIRTLDRLGIESVAVYSDADRLAEHVVQATTAVRLGEAPLTSSYLRIDAVLDAVAQSGAQAVHPGYGLLSESASFARACEAAGVTFIGPTPEQLEQFGLKHTARELAAKAGVALVPGSDVCLDAESALAAAETIGYPVMVKASAGGGGIGMRRCNDATEVVEAYEAVARLATNNFGDPSIFVERYVANARHLEVQIVGDGEGAVVDLGERDCSTQRRNQKVIEEAPAPGISEQLRQRLCTSAADLGRSVGYRSAGTVEFVVDADSLDRADGGDAWFLEVNTRLQVEHGVTELVRNIDLVEWMVLLAAGQRPEGFDDPPPAQGWAMEARLYAEDPAADFAPSSGLITRFEIPEDVRVDGWVRSGSEISPFYDPLLAKILAVGTDREHARLSLQSALEDTHVGGVATNRNYLLDVLAAPEFRAGRFATRTFAQPSVEGNEIVVIDGGLFTTVQDLPGRLGYWDVGVPPSGPLDDRSHRLANELLGNDPGAAALEVTLTGATIQFRADCSFVLGGADFGATLDEQPVPRWSVIDAPAGSTLRLGTADGPGMRGVVAFAGGLSVPDHLGSASTFVLGGFGGHGGRALRAGDVVALGDPGFRQPAEVPETDQPELTGAWTVGVLPGPHAAPDYFTDDDIAMLYRTEWEVHFNSDRTGVRLVGPAPQWARADGGEAGLHPSNIHDNAYAIGTIDFTGDMPIVLGRDGPSLGGFVCPATVAEREFWKIGQARPGDTVRFVPITEAAARRSRPLETEAVGESPLEPVLARLAGTPDHPGLTVRRDGDRNLLVEYGANVLDLLLRLRAGALLDAVRDAEIPGVAELLTGIRSLQVGFDPDRISSRELVDRLLQLDQGLGDISRLEVPSRVVRLPLSWDDQATRLATEKYQRTVRPDAPWCPWNIEFIRRINGLETVEEVKRIVFDASYLVLGLGDVYLGAPVATPVDPRHRLVTTKYNPARTWTAENSVGIGGSYLCIYGMEGPGGYQFVGRTVPIWDRWGRRPSDDGSSRPWLLSLYDQIQWYEVDDEELLELRAEVETGQFHFDITETTFSVAHYLDELAANAEEIEGFNRHRTAAFEAERQRWAEAGIDVIASAPNAGPKTESEPIPEGCVAVAASVSGVVWKIDQPLGSAVTEGDSVMIVEAMKMENPITAPQTGVVHELRVAEGDVVEAGQIVAVLDPSGASS